MKKPERVSNKCIPEGKWPPNERRRQDHKPDKSQQEHDKHESPHEDRSERNPNKPLQNTAKQTCLLLKAKWKQITNNKPSHGKIGQEKPIKEASWPQKPSRETETMKWDETQQRNGTEEQDKENRARKTKTNWVFLEKSRPDLIYLYGKYRTTRESKSNLT
jgi:hypothetical protein